MTWHAYRTAMEFMKTDFVMANLPFHVDEIDADKVRKDPRVAFGLAGVNKKGKAPNGNYAWNRYFCSDLHEMGRAGFLISSQASGAGISLYEPVKRCERRLGP